MNRQTPTSYPRRVELARLPTPLTHLERTSQTLGVEFYVKRDDLTGAELTGNKVRKLEFLIADAIDKGADTLITCGGEQSNHCRATALAATRMGLGSVLLLRTENPASPPADNGNILLDKLAGAEIVWISFDEYARREEIFAREAERLSEQGKKPYVIPEGGSNALGSWGYFRAAEELSAQLGELRPVGRSTIVYACGSGGTGAGLILGGKHFAFAERGICIAGINVCDDREYFVRAISTITGDFSSRFDPKIVVNESDIEIIDGYVGRGYAKSRTEELEEIRSLARREALIVDPVYSGKAYFAITRELARDPERFGDRIVFVHTGGIFGLFPAAELLAPLL